MMLLQKHQSSVFISYGKRETIIFIVVSSYCLHMLRNISEVYALVPIALAMIGFLLYFKKNLSDKFGLIVIASYVVIYLFPIVYSFIWYPDESYTIPALRYLYLIPFLLFSTVVLNRLKFLKAVLITYALFIIFGGLSIYYQMLMGPISWFAEASERDGLVRFASLTGSLTAYGTYGGLAIPIIYFLFKNKLCMWSASIIVVTAMLCTLQKAAVVNILLFGSLIFWFASFRKKITVVLQLVVLASALIVLIYQAENPYLSATVENVFRVQEGAARSDVSLVDGLIGRMWDLPSKLYEMYGLTGMLFGVGLVGGSGTLGFPDYPMAHNGIFDLLFIGGVINLLAFVVLWIFVFLKIRRVELLQAEENDVVMALLASKIIMVMFLINLFVSGPNFIHPYGGVIFYSITAFFCMASPKSILRR